MARTEASTPGEIQKQKNGHHVTPKMQQDQQVYSEDTHPTEGPDIPHSHRKRRPPHHRRKNATHQEGRQQDRCNTVNYVNFNNGKSSNVSFERSQDAQYAGSHQDNKTKGQMNKNTQVTNFNPRQPEPADWNDQGDNPNQAQGQATPEKKGLDLGFITTSVDSHGRITIDDKKIWDGDLGQAVEENPSEEDWDHHVFDPPGLPKTSSTGSTESIVYKVSLRSIIKFRMDQLKRELARLEKIWRDTDPDT